MTIFKYMLSQCGLQQMEAAEYLGFSIDSIRKWSSGDRFPPHKVLKQLTKLHQLEQYLATRIAKEILEKNEDFFPVLYKNFIVQLPEDQSLPMGVRQAIGARAIMLIIKQKKSI